MYCPVYHKAYRAANKEKNRVYQKPYRKQNKEKNRACQKEWCLKNPGRVNAINRRRRKKRCDNDPAFRIRLNISSRLSTLLGGKRKDSPTLRLIGCTLEFLRGYLEKQFRPGMTWENYGRTGWHVDHIKPCAKFDLTDPAQQKQCFCYANLQPLWAEENLKKGDTYG